MLAFSFYQAAPCLSSHFLGNNANPTLFKRQLQIASHETICFPSIEYAQFEHVRYAPKMLNDNHPCLI